MKISDIKELPKYFEHYVNSNEDLELEEAFIKSLKQIENTDIEKLKRIGSKVYAENKWTVNKVIQHVTDWERIWCYRILVSVRNEGEIPRGLDQNIMADNSNADKLPVEKLLSELHSVRMATQAMFSTFSPEMLILTCQFNNNRASVLAMGFNIIGHQLHHFNVIQERYFPLDK